MWLFLCAGRSLTVFISSVMITYMGLCKLFLQMSFGMRWCGAWGPALLTGCLWLMAWHDYTGNLGLRGGWRPLPAFSCRLLCGLYSYWFGRELPAGGPCTGNKTGAAFGRRKEILYWTFHLLAPDLVRRLCQILVGKEPRQEATQKQRIGWQQEAGTGGHRAITVL